MKTFVVDVETFYSQEYSLRRMTTAEYILDPRFECIGWAVQSTEGFGGFMTDKQFRKFLTMLPEEVAFVSHNALFDMCVLRHRLSGAGRIFTPRGTNIS